MRKLTRGALQLAAALAMAAAPAQLGGPGQGSGPASFKVTSSGSALAAVASNADLKEPYRSAMSGGSVIAYELQNTKCPPGTRRANKNHVFIYVLFLDESNAANKLDVDPSKATATMTMHGEMRRWEPAADYCNTGNYQLAARGPGSFTVSMKTGNHMSPRNFMIVNGTGSIQGAGLSTTLGRLPDSGGAPLGSSVAVEEFLGDYEIPDLPGIDKGSVNINAVKPMIVLSMAGPDLIERAPRVIVQLSTSSAAEQPGMTIFEPQAWGGSQVADASEDTIGVQMIVNDDNDDQDEDFDFATRDRDVPGEDDLVRVKLKIQPKRLNNSLGTAKLEITAGESGIRIWNAPTKGSLFDRRKPLIVPTDFKAEGAFLVKDLWIEASEAHTSQRATKLKFTYSNDPKFSDEASITVLGLKSIEWKGLRNSEKNDENLGIDPNHGTPNGAYDPAKPSENVRVLPMGRPGYRVFPGARYSNGQPGELRDRVKLIATLSVKPVAPVKFYFDSFDVDDPTAFQTDDPVDDEVKTEDNRGRVEGAQSPATGQFVGEGSNGLKEVEFTEATAEFNFQVTLQPGDNFRVVGHGDGKFLSQLKNDDKLLHHGIGAAINENKQRIVDPYVLKAAPTTPLNAEVRNAGGALSPTLTVWRFVYVEVDHMDEVKGNFIEGTIARVYPDDPQPGLSRLKLDKNLASALKAKSSAGIADAFQSGKIKLRSTEFNVVSNTAYRWASDEVIVAGRVTSAFEAAPFMLKDDDHKVQQLDEGDPMPRLMLDKVAVIFEPSYVLPDFSTLEPTNRTKTVPFSAFNHSNQPKDISKHYRFDHLAHEKSESAWTVYLLGAFQHILPGDGDPDTEGKVVGIVDQLNGIGANVFLACLRELAPNATPERVASDHADTIAHEIAHLFNAEHSDGEIMDQAGPAFSATSLQKIRSTKSP